MDLQLALQCRTQVEEFRRKYRIGLLVLVFTDIVDWTRLKDTLGDRRALALTEQHHDLIRQILSNFKEAEEINCTGDSFFLAFAKPSDAIRFSLILQARLRAAASASDHPVLDRIGIHVGEVFIEEGEHAGKAVDIYGIQVDTCARIMSLATGGQVLLSRVAFDHARTVLRGQDIDGVGPLSWVNHGLYRMKGIEDALEVCEVGEIAKAPLTPPHDSDKARRHISPDTEIVSGWRPAVGQSVPRTQWVLERKLGEGGFGEVWLGQHQTLKERRVFKFCFRADRVRSLKREVTLFKLLKERVGDHPNIVGVQEICFDEPPFYLILDYADGQDLAAWCQACGGIDKVPLATRLEIVAQVADALQAAQDAGVIHRDVKPSNILVTVTTNRGVRPGTETEGTAAGAIHGAESKRPSAVQVKLTDFGIGQVISQEALAAMTRLGFTQTMMSPGSTQSGTHLYMAPELMAGKSASAKSDIYALGVVLYQLIAGDFSRPVTSDWQEAVTDPVLREDLKGCLAGDPDARFSRPSELAANLRLLRTRHAQAIRKWRFQAAAALILWAGAFILVSGSYGGLQRCEMQTYDWRMRHAEGRVLTNAPNLGLVEISDSSITQLSTTDLAGRKVMLYWPRFVYGQILDELAYQGASTVAFDVLFPDRREDHPPAILPDGSTKESDRFFADVLRDSGIAVLGADRGLLPDDLFRTNALALGEISAILDWDGVLRRARVFVDYYSWNPLIRQAMYALGMDPALTVVRPGGLILRSGGGKEKVLPLDAENRFNQVALYEELTGSRVPGNVKPMRKAFDAFRVWDMGIVAAARELGIDLASARVETNRHQIVLRGANGIERIIPIDTTGCFLIDWRLKVNAPGLHQEPIESLLLNRKHRLKGEPASTNHLWRGRIAVIGSTAQGNDLTDRGATPLESQTYLTTRFLNVANMMLVDSFIHSAPPWLTFVLTAFMAVMAGWATRCLRLSWSTLLVALLILVEIVVADWLFTNRHYYIPIVFPVSGALFLGYGSIVTYRRLMGRPAVMASLETHRALSKVALEKAGGEETGRAA